jgi:hypothetical protein
MMQRAIVVVLVLAILALRYLGWVPGLGRLLALVAALAVLALLRYLPRALGKAAVAKLPGRIHLEPVTAPAWRNPGAVGTLVDPLLAAGFVDAGAYRVVEMQGVLLRLLRLPDEGIRATVMDHPRAETPVLTLSAEFADGTRLELTNLRGTIETRPHPSVTKVRAPGASAEAMVARFRAERPNQPAVAAPIEGAAAAYEREYAVDVAWMKDEGAPTAAEVASFVRKRSGDNAEKIGGVAAQAAGGAPERRGEIAVAEVASGVEFAPGQMYVGFRVRKSGEPEQPGGHDGVIITTRAEMIGGLRTFHAVGAERRKQALANVSAALTKALAGGFPPSPPSRDFDNDVVLAMVLRLLDGREVERQLPVYDLGLVLPAVTEEGIAQFGLPPDLVKELKLHLE